MPTLSKSKMYNVLQKSDVIRNYEISIIPSAVEGLKRSPTEYDFTNIDMLTDIAPQHCYYEIQRQQITTHAVENLAIGRIEIRDGRVIFLSGYWRTGGLASPEFLLTEGNLVMNADGNLVGRIPYFHVFIDPGEVAQPPKYVTLGENEKKRGMVGEPTGLYTFTVDDWQIGRFKIQKCTNL